MSEAFLIKLKNYLDERLKNEVLVCSFKPFEIYTLFPSGSPWKWQVHTESWTAVRTVEGFVDGTVVIKTDLLDRAGDHIRECLVRSYRYKFAKAKDNKEEEERVDKAFQKEKKEAREDYFNRRNFEKHLKKSYWSAFLRLLWFDEVARRISEEYGVKVEVLVDEVSCESGLESKFNGSNMDEEKKFEEIKKRVEAVVAAYKLAHTAYQTYPLEKRKEYLEFAKAVLAKYGVKRRRL
ncbi:MAG: hypothetical protein QXI87_00180 [Thermoproteota archaeon]